jgi:hypothetical protein
MRIRLNCLPGYIDHLPKPVLAGAALPDWLRAMPAEAAADALGGAVVRTVKQCPPFVDALRTGVLFPLAAALTVRAGELSWDWDLPVHPVARPSRAPIGVHLPEQAAGVPGLPEPTQLVVKFTNFWTVALPEGWSMLFTHPLNRLDLPFRTISGVVDCDSWTDGLVHFSALWSDPDFEGVLPAGTPVAQGILLRREPIELEIGDMPAERLAAHVEVQDGLQAEPGLYRKRYRRGPEGGAAKS